MSWTDETKAAAIEKYEAAEPTPENSMEIVKEIAEEMGESPNGVRMILSQAGVYVKKDAKKAPASTTSASGGDKAPRVSKEAAHQALTAAIEAAGGEVDSEIVSKLTGKAAQYFTGVLKAATGGDQED